MKTFIYAGLCFMLIAFSCTQQTKNTATSIENTLKSISWFSDSTQVEPAVLFTNFEKVNKAIDSLGYPDAGYKLWLIQSDTVKNIRFMIEGCWPDQATYDKIHQSKLYTDAMREVQKSAMGLRTVSYNRFTLVK
jgi:hypothetical protein